MAKKPTVNVSDRRLRLEAEARSDSTEHIWMVTLGYRLSDENAEDVAEGGPITADHENLVAVGGPICWRCQSPFNKYPCPGPRRPSSGPVEAEIVEED